MYDLSLVILAIEINMASLILAIDQYYYSIFNKRKSIDDDIQEQIVQRIKSNTEYIENRDKSILDNPYHELLMTLDDHKGFVFSITKKSKNKKGP